MERTPRQPEPPSIPDEMVDAFFDRELTEGASDEFFAKLRSNLPRCSEVAQVQRAISMLRQPIEAPDVTDRVLATLSHRRRFLPERLRKMVTRGRLVAAGIALTGVLGIAIVDRVSPGMLRLSTPAQPVSGLVSSAAPQSRTGMAQLANAANGIRIVTEVMGPPSTEQGAPRIRPHGMVLSLQAGVTSAKVLPGRAGSLDSLVVYRGAGPEMRFTLPEAVYIDKNAAIVLPLGHMSSSRIGSMEWAGISRDNLFLLPAVEPESVGGAAVAPVQAQKKRTQGP